MSWVNFWMGYLSGMLCYCRRGKWEAAARQLEGLCIFECPDSAPEDAGNWQRGRRLTFSNKNLKQFSHELWQWARRSLCRDNLVIMQKVLCSFGWEGLWLSEADPTLRKILQCCRFRRKDVNRAARLLAKIVSKHDRWRELDFGRFKGAPMEFKLALLSALNQELEPYTDAGHECFIPHVEAQDALAVLAGVMGIDPMPFKMAA